MKLLDFLIIAAVIGCAIACIAALRRGRGKCSCGSGGCGGSCASCGACCACEKARGNENKTSVSAKKTPTEKEK